MKDRKIVYIYGKYFGMGAFILIMILFLFLYFFPSINEINSKKRELKNNTAKIKAFQKELENFQPPDEEERALWIKIESMMSKNQIVLKNRAEFLTYVNELVENLKDVLSSYYDDFLINIDDKYIKITQTLKRDSVLLSEFKYLSVFTPTKNEEFSQNATFRAFDRGDSGLSKNRIENPPFEIKVFVMSDLKKTSYLLVSMFKKISFLTVEKIRIKRTNNITYYLIVLKFRVKRSFEGAKE